MAVEVGVRRCTTLTKWLWWWPSSWCFSSSAWSDDDDVEVTLRRAHARVSPKVAHLACSFSLCVCVRRRHKPRRRRRPLRRLASSARSVCVVCHGRPAGSGQAASRARQSAELQEQLELAGWCRRQCRRRVAWICAADGAQLATTALCLCVTSRSQSSPGWSAWSSRRRQKWRQLRERPHSPRERDTKLVARLCCDRRRRRRDRRQWYSVSVVRSKVALEL